VTCQRGHALQRKLLAMAKASHATLAPSLQCMEKLPTLIFTAPPTLSATNAPVFFASLSVLHNTNNNDYLLNVAFLFRHDSEEAALRRHYLKYELKHI
jgi:hypothetical protein